MAKRAEQVPQWALRRLKHKRRLWERRRKVFLQSLGDYPEPRAEQEWRAYKALRQWWTRPQIRQFISAYGADELVYPGTLGSQGRPSFEEFMHDVGLLAGGEYARTLPRKETLSLVAGADARRGVAIIESASRGGHARLGIYNERDKAMAKEFLDRSANRRGNLSDTALKTEIGRQNNLTRSAAVAAINRGLLHFSSG